MNVELGAVARELQIRNSQFQIRNFFCGWQGRNSSDNFIHACRNQGDAKEGGGGKLEFRIIPSNLLRVISWILFLN